MKWITSPGSMHDTGCLGLVHWDNPDGWCGEGGCRVGQFRMGNKYIPVVDSCWCMAKLKQYCKVICLQLNKFILKKKKKKKNWSSYHGQQTSPKCSTWMQFKNNRMISVHFQGKPFNITVIQVYSLTGNAEEAEVEWLYEDLQDFLELTPKKDIFSL